MASVLIDGLRPGSVSQFAYHACFFKRNWADDWTWVPYVRAKWAEEAAAPNVAEASLEWVFGEQKQHFDAAYYFYEPLLVSNAYVMIRAYNQWGNWPVFIGVVQRETAAVAGTTWPQGDQAFSAFSVEHLLDRNEINGAYTDAGFIERAVSFNRKDSHGLSEQGNRSTDPDGEAYLFSSDGEKWSNLQIADYLVRRFVNDGVPFVVVGATDALDAIVVEHEFHGQSVLAALHQLIDRRYGLNFRLLVPDTPGETIYIYVFSQLAFPLQIGDTSVPANPVQAVVPIIGDHAIDPVFTFDSLAQFDSVDVRGSNLVVCGTFSYTDGTLEKGWSDEAESLYITPITSGPDVGDADAADRSRREERFDVVYQRHRVVRNWDGKLGDGAGEAGMGKNNAHPVVTDDGEIDWDNQSIFWMGQRKFLREIPIELATYDTDAPTEYRPAVAFIRHPTDGSYAQIEKAWPDDTEAQFPAHLSLPNFEMGVDVKPQINHVYGLSHFSESADTNVTPTFDYTQLIVTAAFQADVQLKAFGMVAGQYLTETGRTKVIQVPEAQYWVILPNTVTDVVDGQLVRPYADYHVVRDDHQRLQQILALALVWFGFARGTLSMRYKTITPAWPVSTLIIGAQGTWHATVLGSVVTKKRWDFERNETEIASGSDEMVFQEGVMKFKKAMLG